MLSLVVQKYFNFMVSHLLNVILSACTIGVMFRESFHVPMSSRLFTTFSCIRFSWILCRVISMNLFIYWQASIQFDQHHFWRCFFQCALLNSLFKKNYVFINMRTYVWVFNSVLLMCILCQYKLILFCFYYSSVVQFEIRDDDNPAALLLFRIDFCYLWFSLLLFPDEAENYPFNISEELCWNFDWCFTESVDCFW